MQSYIISLLYIFSYLWADNVKLEVLQGPLSSAITMFELIDIITFWVNRAYK